jgi:sulfur-oxidizing protein SoxB
MARYIAAARAPHLAKLAQPLAVSEGLLYRRGNFNGSFDELILDALMQAKGAEIAFSPGFRWGTTLLPGETITLEHVLEQTAITYPSTTVNTLNGEQIRLALEDIADNLFNPDPYLQQGGDMVRVGGMTYALDPVAKIGGRVFDMRLNGRPLQANKRYRVAGWAPVAADAEGEPIWDVLIRYLRDKKTIPPLQGSTPRLVGVQGNPGLA